MAKARNHWPRPAPEIIKLVQSLAIADARRDHEEAVRASSQKHERLRKEEAAEGEKAGQ